MFFYFHFSVSLFCLLISEGFSRANPSQAAIEFRWKSKVNKNNSKRGPPSIVHCPVDPTVPTMLKPSTQIPTCNTALVDIVKLIGTIPTYLPLNSEKLQIEQKAVIGLD